MPLVQRDQGAIVGLYAGHQPRYAEEWLPKTDPAIISFRNLSAPAPEGLSRWQLFITPALAGIITQQQTEDAITGPLPPSFLASIATMPEGQQFTVTMLLRGSQIFQRRHRSFKRSWSRSGRR